MVFTRKSTLPRSPPSLDTHWHPACRIGRLPAARARARRIFFGRDARPTPTESELDAALAKPPIKDNQEDCWFLSSCYRKPKVENNCTVTQKRISSNFITTSFYFVV
jgi:hypothetical protein